MKEMNGYKEITEGDYDECRKLWLIHNVGVDPHAGDERVYSLNTLDVTYAYDLGYRQALLALRTEFDIQLIRLKVESSRNIFKADVDNQGSVKSHIAASFIEVIRQRIDEKIEVSYQTEGYEIDNIRWQRKRNCQNSGDW